MASMFVRRSVRVVVIVCLWSKAVHTVCREDASSTSCGGVTTASMLQRSTTPVIGVAGYRIDDEERPPELDSQERANKARLLNMMKAENSAAPQTPAAMTSKLAKKEATTKKDKGPAGKLFRFGLTATGGVWNVVCSTSLGGSLCQNVFGSGNNLKKLTDQAFRSIMDDPDAQGKIREAFDRASIVTMDFAGDEELWGEISQKLLNAPSPILACIRSTMLRAEVDFDVTDFDATHVADWMGLLNPKSSQLRFFDINLPGSHDAASVAGVEWETSSSSLHSMSNNYDMAVTQSLNVGDQLLAGSRYLDLRFSRVKENEWRGAHAIYLFESMPVIMAQVHDFCKAHDNEIILIRLKPYGSGDKQYCSELSGANGYITKWLANLNTMKKSDFETTIGQTQLRDAWKNANVSGCLVVPLIHKCDGYDEQIYWSADGNVWGEGGAGSTNGKAIADHIASDSNKWNPGEE